MVILLTGASGFIGRHLLARLSAAGHDLRCVSRTAPPEAPGAVHVPADFSRDFNVEAWLPRLAGVDVVINAAGIFRERGAQTFEALHERAPAALFEACARTGVRRIVQISALGADEHAQSRFHLSKKRCDDRLLALRPDAAVIQPSLVYGAGGVSAALFNRLAVLPLVPLPGSGDSMLQPIHVKDLVDAVAALLCERWEACDRIAAVGPRPLSLRQYLAELRGALGLAPAWNCPLPSPAVALAARLGDMLPGLGFDTDAWRMLQRGNTAPAARITEILGYPPCPVRDFITPSLAPAVRVQAQLSWLLPLLRLSVAAVWIVTGLVSLWGFPREDSLALLARTGLTGQAATMALHVAAWLDIGLGIATLFLNRAWLWRIQMALILAYTVIISLHLPEFWLHPYGPILKNLPMLAVLWLLHEVDRKPWST